MIVHPAKGHWEGTLASALAHHFGPLSGRGGPTRPGIVHRLDRDTSGVIVVAKNDQAHDALAAQFKSRDVEKEYLAIVVGVPDRDRDVIDEPIGDHPTQREKKAIRREDAERAAGRDRCTKSSSGSPAIALVRALPKTGRTHQIRLHLAHVGYPVLCDRLYGGRAANHRTGIDSARQNRAGYERAGTRATSHCSNGRRCTPIGWRLRIRRAASECSSKRRCRPTWNTRWQRCGDGDRNNVPSTAISHAEAQRRKVRQL